MWTGYSQRCRVGLKEYPHLVLPGQGSGGGHWDVMPPSAVITEPVRNEESSLARKSATAAISSGVPSLPIGYLTVVSASPAARSPPPRARSMGSISGV